MANKLKKIVFAFLMVCFGFSHSYAAPIVKLEDMSVQFPTTYSGMYNLLVHGYLEPDPDEGEVSNINVYYDYKDIWYNTSGNASRNSSGIIQLGKTVKARKDARVYFFVTVPGGLKTTTAETKRAVIDPSYGTILPTNTACLRVGSSTKGCVTRTSAGSKGDLELTAGALVFPPPNTSVIYTRQLGGIMGTTTQYYLAPYSSRENFSVLLVPDEGFEIDEQKIVSRGGTWDEPFYTTPILGGLKTDISWSTPIARVAMDRERTVNYGSLSASFNWGLSVDANRPNSVTYEDPKGTEPIITTIDYNTHDLQMTNSVTTTTFKTTPDGGSPSTLTANNIDDLNITTNGIGEATVAGTTNGNDFEIFTDKNGNSVITYTNSNGDITTLSVPNPNNIVVNSNGTITATHNGQSATINSNGTTTFTGADGSLHAIDAGETINITATDVLWDKSFTVIYNPNNGDLNTTKQLAYASNPTNSAPIVSKTNYVLGGWLPQTSYLTADVNLTAKWNPEPGVIDSSKLTNTADDNTGWKTENIDYATLDSSEQNTTLHYYDDGNVAVSVSGGDGDDLVHTFNYTTHDINLTNATDGNTSFSILPDGETTPSTITADGISPITATINEVGDANLSGSVNGSSFEIITTPDGNTTITYTNADGNVTTAQLPHPNNVVVNEDGSISTSFPLLKDVSDSMTLGDWTYDSNTGVYSSGNVAGATKCMTLDYTTVSSEDISFDYNATFTSTGDFFKFYINHSTFAHKT